MSTFALSVERRSQATGAADEHHFLRSDEMKRVDGRDDAWSWMMKDVVTGRHVVSIEPLLFSISVDVGPEGKRDVLLEMPPPGKVFVRVVDATSGEEALVDSVNWNPRRPEGVLGGSLETAKRDPSSGLFVFSAPQCDIDVSTWSMVYDDANDSLRVGSGRNELTLRVARSQGLLIILKDGDVELPVDVRSDMNPKEIDGDGEGRMWGGTARGMRITVTKPGRYRFAVPKIDGYLPVPDQEVVIEAGKIQEHVIQLQRQ